MSKDGGPKDKEHYTVQAATFIEHRPHLKGWWVVWAGGCAVNEFKHKTDALLFCEAANYARASVIGSVASSLNWMLAEREKPR